MSIAIFESVTTEESLSLLEAEAEKYTGLHVEMDNKEERKFVKDKASLISGLLKKLDRARIDISKEYKTKVEAEALLIKVRLEKANEPFTLLIDEHKERRAKILAEKKAKEEAKELAIQIIKDHEDAITMDKIRTFEIQEAEREKKEKEEELKKQARREAEIQTELAEKRAEQAEKEKIIAEAKARRDAEQAEAQRVKDVEDAKESARLKEVERQRQEKIKRDAEKARMEANKAHVGRVRKQIKEHIMKGCEIDESLAKKIVLSLIETKLITINY